MKASYKAALLSLFVFPGIGHLYLKKYRRGLIILFFVIAGVGFLIWSATVSALDRLDDAMTKMQGGAANLKELSAVVGATMSTPGPYLDVVFYVVVCFWIFAVIDSYRIGKQREIQGKGLGGSWQA